jgi:hypothetical protein
MGVDPHVSTHALRPADTQKQKRERSQMMPYHSQMMPHHSQMMPHHSRVMPHHSQMMPHHENAHR